MSWSVSILPKADKDLANLAAGARRKDLELALADEFKQAFITHVFHKSQDPDYRRAVTIHEQRAAEFIDGFKGFLDRRR